MATAATEDSDAANGALKCIKDAVSLVHIARREKQIAREKLDFAIQATKDAERHRNEVTSAEFANNSEAARTALNHLTSNPISSHDEAIQSTVLAQTVDATSNECTPDNEAHIPLSTDNASVVSTDPTPIGPRCIIKFNPDKNDEALIQMLCEMNDICNFCSTLEGVCSEWIIKLQKVWPDADWECITTKFKAGEFKFLGGRTCCIEDRFPKEPSSTDSSSKGPLSKGTSSKILLSRFPPKKDSSTSDSENTSFEAIRVDGGQDLPNSHTPMQIAPEQLLNGLAMVAIN